MVCNSVDNSVDFWKVGVSHERIYRVNSMWIIHYLRCNWFNNIFLFFCVVKSTCGLDFQQKGT